MARIQYGTRSTLQHPIGPVAPAAALRRGPQPGTPPTSRRDLVRPAGRPPRQDGPASGRPVRGGGCAVQPARLPVPAARVRLTVRGRRFLAALAMVCAVGVAALAAPAMAADTPGSGLELAGQGSVVVAAGDTLWSIASAHAPDEDPRSVVDAIQELNDLEGATLQPGQVLRLP